jgi:mannose-1-phosphate guanylyltransferase/mannose-1-phosphate guanylyltransferase/mannose-6-phosphate isomerase
MKKIVPVILSGGSGTRLWPISRQLYPKQFQAIHGDKTLFQQSLERVKDADIFAPPICIANEDHRFILAEQARQVDAPLGAIILEPEGRNTLPAIAMAVSYVRQHIDEQAIILVMPSDHIIESVEVFHADMLRAIDAANEGKIVCFGVEPTFPATVYGYIEAQSGSLPQEGSPIKRFVEKPDAETAQSYLDQGGYYWNSGIFQFRCDTMIKEFTAYDATLMGKSDTLIRSATKDLDFIRIDAAQFAALPNISIDYAIMEKTDKGFVAPAHFQWSDVGGFTALWELNEKDQNGNVHIGDVISQQTKGCYIRSDGPLIAVSDVEDLNIIVNSGVTLISKKGFDQNIGILAKELKRLGRSEVISAVINSTGKH